jgi:tyrosine-protein kinase Etk/Wzc
MASGAHLPVAGELLRSYKLDALMAELRAKFDFLVLDGPSVTTSADSLILSLKCQVTFLIYSAQAPSTLRGALRSAVNHLLVRRAGTPVKVTSSLRGVIMNRCI